MRYHFAMLKWWGLLICISLFHLPSYAQSVSGSSVDEFMGVTTRGQDPIPRLQAVGTVREFHPWTHNEGFANNNGSPDYPNNLYRWNPNYIDYIRYDDFYSEISNQGISISPVTIRSISQVVSPFLSQGDPQANFILSAKPVMMGDDPLIPASYISHGAFLYQKAARYGKTIFTPARLNTIITPRQASGETAVTGLGYLDYIEDWNEPDQNDIFSPQELAAMLSADYDGHAQTLGLIPDPDNLSQMISTIGVKNADPTIKMAMAGLETADLDYIRQVVDWSVNNRPVSAQFGQLPFDVINIHRYVGNNPDFFQSTAAISPEAGGLRPFLETFVTYRDSLDPTKELWLSEFGFDTNLNSPISVPDNIGNFTQYQVQGQWIMRSYLETVAAGFDRAMLFDLRDGCTGEFCTLFTSAGLVETQFNGFKPKDSWYYVSTMKNVLTDMEFEADLTTCNDLSCPRIYRFVDQNNPNKKIYAVWAPTSNATTYDINLSLEGANSATLVEMGVPSIKGITSPLTGTDPTITVSETPVFVIVGDNSYASGTGCTSNVSASDQTCGTVKINWDSPNGVQNFQLWYMDGALTAADFSAAQATLVVDDIDATLLSYTVADLPSNTALTFFLIPEGVAVDPTNPNTAPICFVQTSTVAETVTCQIPLDASMIFDPIVSLDNADNMVDEQSSVNPFCSPNLQPGTFWGFDFDPFSGEPNEKFSLDLGMLYNVDALAIFDGGGIGTLEIQRADASTGPWTIVTTYQTISTFDWVYFTDLFPNQSVQYLRFIASDDDLVQIGELFLCGSPVDPPSNEISDFEENNTGCTSTDLSWTLPTNSIIDQIRLVVTTTMGLEEILLPATTNTYTLNNLLPNMVYECFLYGESSGTTNIALDIVTFQTQTTGCVVDDPPGAVSNFQVADIACENLVLSWTPPTDNDIAGYMLNVQPGNQDYSFSPIRTPIAFDLANLNPNTNYQFELKVVDYGGNESPVQTIAATTLESSQCSSNNNCDPNCPTYICVESSWLTDLANSPHIDCSRLFDEAGRGNPICGENGTPNTEWGEDHTPGLGIPPTVCTLDLQTTYNISSIYLFDAESQGNFKVEYQNATGDWIEITTYNTAPYNVWHPIDNLNILARHFRFSKLEQSAKITEIAIFGTLSL